MPIFATRDLALYASIVGTLNGAWTLYHGVIRDRPRIVVRATRAEAVGAIGPRDEVFMLTVSNRGRRAVSIDSIARYARIVRGTSIVTTDFMQQTSSKPRLEESQSKTFVHGQMGGYKHGDLPESRWYVVDGAGRIWPLRQRCLQRVCSFSFWPIRRVWRWHDKLARQRAKVERDDYVEL